jgi:DNA-directed RNA polymerase
MAFAAVHDSYWTHAATVEDMSVAIRDSFVHLHSSNVLENLLAEVRQVLCEGPDLLTYLRILVPCAI